MSTKNITIHIPEGYKIDSFDKETGQINFAPIPKTIQERIKNFDDVLKETGFSLKGLSKDEKAYRKLKLINAALNEDWTPNWDNSSEPKYYPWFKMASGGFSYYVCDRWITNSFSHAGFRLCFKSRELAEYAGKTFTDIYKDFLTL